MNKIMNFRLKLSRRIQIKDVHEIINLIRTNDKRIYDIYRLLFDKDDVTAYQAAWVLTHLSWYDNQLLFCKQNELIDEVLLCTHPGKRRLILSLLYRQPLKYPPRTDFLDFCLEHINSQEVLPGIQMLCMKISYELCRTIPELLLEFRATLELMEPYLLPASISSVRKNLMKAMKSRKSLQNLKP